jgi:hypothetical protein
MYGFVPWLVLLGTSAARAQETPAKADSSQATPAERYRDVLKAYQKAEEDFFAEYHKAKTDDERTKLFQTKRPDQGSYADKMLKIAEDAPKDPVAVEALIWAATNTAGPKAEKAMKALTANHVKDPKISSLCSRMLYDESPQAETFLREVLAKNAGQEAKGQACLALGQKLKMQAEQAGSKEKSEAMTKEAESLLERVTKEFASVKNGEGTLGDLAKNELNELRNLGIGKTAPEIKGEDIDGKALKLTDFRGKVVVLDFWGDW